MSRQMFRKFYCYNSLSDLAGFYVAPEKHGKISSMKIWYKFFPLRKMCPCRVHVGLKFCLLFYWKVCWHFKNIKSQVSHYRSLTKVSANLEYWPHDNRNVISFMKLRWHVMFCQITFNRQEIIVMCRLSLKRQLSKTVR